MSVSILREPLHDYLANNMPDTSWDAARATIAGDLIKDGYSKGEFIHITIRDNHLALSNSNNRRKDTLIYFYQDDFLDRLLEEARTRYQRKLVVVNRAEHIADIRVSLNQKDLQYLASYYGTEPDCNDCNDYSDIINTLMAEKVKHLERCRQSRSSSLVT